MRTETGPFKNARWRIIPDRAKNHENGVMKTRSGLTLRFGGQYTYFDFLLGGQVNHAWFLVQNGVQSGSHC